MNNLLSATNLMENNNITSISSDYTMTGDEQLIMIDSTSGDVEITLPSLSNAPVGSIQEFKFLHPKGTNNVKITCDGTDTFTYSNTYFNLGTQKFNFTIARYNDGSNQSWGLVKNLNVRGCFHRDGDWASSNFSSTTIIPWDSKSYNNNDELLIYTSSTNARVTVKTAGTYVVSYLVDLDSTGGSTWNAVAQVYKNGSAVEALQVTTGNYGGEDQSMACIPTYIDLVADDYLDLRISQSSLTGSLTHSIFNIEITL